MLPEWSCTHRYTCCTAVTESYFDLQHPEFAALCGKLHVLLLQAITCPIINSPQLSRLLFLWGKAFISSLCRISKWYIIATVWYVVATAFETPWLVGYYRIVHVAILKRDPILDVLKSWPATSVLGKCILFSMLVFFVLLCHLRHTVTETITRYVILYTGLQNNSFLVQEYHTFCGRSFNLQCMTLFACSEEYVTASTRKPVVILHRLMLIFISATSTQESNFSFPKSHGDQFKLSHLFFN